MLKHRVIPALLLSGNGLVKTTRFKNPEYVGDPINTIRIFNEKEVDELIVLDIMATKEGREPNYELIEEFAGECFMPLTYGGGVRSVEQARQIFALGVEKICIKSAAYTQPNIVSELSDQFGSQSIMLSVDVKRNWRGYPQILEGRNHKYKKVDWLEMIVELSDRGVGEVLLNAVDKDGTLSGPDLDLIQKVARAIDVPLIAVGGVSSIAEIKLCVDAGASAVAAGAFFIYHGPHRAVLITYPNYRDLEELFS